MHRCTTPILNQPHWIVSLFIFLVAALSVALPYISALVALSQAHGIYPVTLRMSVTPRNVTRIGAKFGKWQAARCLRKRFD